VPAADDADQNSNADGNGKSDERAVFDFARQATQRVVA
jgi:hypothetical protein